MLRKISYIFPSINKEEKDFFHTLVSLLSELPSIHRKKDEIVIIPQKPAQAFPVTSFASGDVSLPQLVFDNAKGIAMEVGSFFIHDTKAKRQIYLSEQEEIIGKRLRRDAVGEYQEIVEGANTYYLLSINELAKRLQNHIVRIDHTGVNIPTKVVDQRQYDAFIQKIGSYSNLYRYPTGEPWLFILPSTLQEYKNDIKESSLGREPKFEIVYDTYETIPTIQIDIESDLTRSEVEKILPEPYGISFPGLAEYFRTVYISHPWSKLAIRFDIRFKSDELYNDWNTGKWLVKSGGRIVKNNKS